MRPVVTTRTAYREDIRAHVAPAVSPRTVGISLHAAGLTSYVPLALISRQRQARMAILVL